MGRARDGAATGWREAKLHWRAFVRDGVRSFQDNDLLSYASAIAFQVLFALVPLALTAVALLGFLSLEEVWEKQLAPTVKRNVEDDSFTLLERTVGAILGEKRGLWLTFGLAFALWRVSSAVRSTMRPLNAIYGVEEKRRWWARLLVSLALALAIAPALIAATVLVQLGPLTEAWLDPPAVLALVVFVVRWAAAVALLVASVWLLIRFAPAERQPFAWAGIGSVFVVATWLFVSLAFGFYASSIADYGSVFGNLASLIVLVTYLYISAIALLFGIQLDAEVREAARGGERARPRHDRLPAGTSSRQPA